MYKYKARLIKVVDGDTVDLMVDCGFNIHIKERFRLSGINAPEIRIRNKEEKKKGLEAKEFLMTLLHPYNKITIHTEKDKKGKYGRYLAELWVNGQCVNKLMVGTGHAVEQNY